MSPKANCLHSIIIIQLLFNLALSKVAGCVPSQTLLQQHLQTQIDCEDLAEFVGQQSRDLLLSIIPPQHQVNELDTSAADCKSLIAWMTHRKNADCSLSDEWIVQCTGTVTIKSLNDHNIIDWNALCDKVTADNPHGTCADVDLPGIAGNLCEWKAKRPYLTIFDQREQNLATLADLNIFEKYTGFGDAAGIRMDFVKFDDPDRPLLIEARERARTESVRQPRRVSAEDGLHKIQSLTGTMVEITTEYDVRQEVHPEDELITEEGWNNIGKLGFIRNERTRSTRTLFRRCSAEIIGPEWLIGSPHCAVDDTSYPMGKAMLYNEIRFVAGFNGEAANLLTGEEIEEVYIPIGFMNAGYSANGRYDMEAYDYMLLKVKNAAYDHYWSIGYDNDDAFWRDHTFHTAGYPQDKLSHFLYYSPLEFNEIHVNQFEKKQEHLYHRTLVTRDIVQDVGRKSWHGQSGSGVWAFNAHSNGVNEIMGILSAGCVLKGAALDEKEHIHRMQYREHMQEYEHYEEQHDTANMQRVKTLKEEDVADIQRIQQARGNKGYGTQVVRITPDKFWRILHVTGLRAIATTEAIRRERSSSGGVSSGNKEYLGIIDYDDDNEYYYKSQLSTLYWYHQRYYIIDYILMFIAVVMMGWICGLSICIVGVINGHIIYKLNERKQLSSITYSEDSNEEMDDV